MAQLVLTAASSAIGAVGKAGAGAAIARSLASTAASAAAGGIERLVFGPRRRRIEGPRLEALPLQASTEGAAIPRVFGRARIAGQIIWAAQFRESRIETREESGGKGGPAVVTERTDFAYSLSFAVGLCEGPIDRIARVWADGRPFDFAAANARVYHGAEDQTPDALIEATEGAAPGFRGLAFVVFEDLPLGPFGNRIPQFSFEIEAALGPVDPGALENALTAVSLIPGSGEFALGTTPVIRLEGPGVSAPENVHGPGGRADIEESLDALVAAAPNLKSVAVIVAWFGDDLRAERCRLRPGVETRDKETMPYSWSAGGVDRAGAHLVSLHQGAPAYGGTPADRSVVEAIAAIKARGLEVMLHPFILMDIPAGADLPNPDGVGLQGAYPWRGRIAARSGAAASADVDAFFGMAEAAHFSDGPEGVVYSGPDEWGYRRMVLHLGMLARRAGGVEAFLIGSELRGLTGTTSGGDAFPAVGQLRALAREARAILGPQTKISYGADWSEWSNWRADNGSGDVYFHLDALWMDENINFIGINNYAPIADWRDGLAHLDAARARGPHDLDYLKSNIAGGENFDWFYASPNDRAAQIRTPIIDAAHGEDWVFRAKDVHGWWSNAHHNRPGGVRAPAPTAWVPGAKQFRFTETGCAAVDKGANAPNAFPDPKSAENALPPFSTGARDDLMLRRVIEAQAAFWRAAANNPPSALTGAPMVDAMRAYVWAWDARPFPFFPARADVWGDAAQWARGHWLNGRLGRAPVDLLVRAICAGAGVEEVDASALSGVAGGYVIDRPMSPREAIDPLADIFRFDAIETPLGLRFSPRDGAAVIALSPQEFVALEEGPFALSRAQGEDAPAAFRLGFLDEARDYAPAVAEARQPDAGPAGSGEAAAEAPLALDAEVAAAQARAVLAEAHINRERISFALPPSFLALEPGDVVAIDLPSGDGAPARRANFRILDIADGAERRIEAVRSGEAHRDHRQTEQVAGAVAPVSGPAVYGPPDWALLDLPALARSGAAGEETRPLLAAFADPWPGEIALWRLPEGDGTPVLAGSARARALIGRLTSPLPPGAAGRRDWRGVHLRLAFGQLSARPLAEMLAGANAAAVEVSPASQGGGAAAALWEVVQFRHAALEPSGDWRLSELLRGQAGTEDAALVGAAVGARVVILTSAATAVDAPLDLRGEALDWTAGPASAAPLPGALAFAPQRIAFTARGLTPLSPVRLRGRQGPEGLHLSWIRRSRIGADGWTAHEPPLGEAAERYRVEIREAATDRLLRMAETAEPFHLYGVAEAAADFPPADYPEGEYPLRRPTIRVRVAQLSDRVGPGGIAEEVF